LLVSIALWRTVSKPVQDLEAGMEAVAAGQFDYRLSVSPTRNDEFGRLAASYKSMAAQLAQLDRLKAEFVSVASHELKTPINVILGYLQLLNEGVYGSISAKQGEILRTVDAQTRSLSRLVHQLLDISRFEAGGGKLDLRPTELGHFLSDLESTFEVLSMQRGIHFRVVRTGPLPAEVVWDPDRINEVLGNLLSNAFKFTKKDGTVELDVQADGGQIRVTVSDTGAGIPPEQLPHIFRKFFQADNQHSAAHDGTGLGLAIAKQIVDAHGGKLTVESRVGEGTTFSIVLPVRTGPRPRRRSAATTSVDASA
jgi:signal transduction histidine kinase